MASEARRRDKRGHSGMTCGDPSGRHGDLKVAAYMSGSRQANLTLSNKPLA
jgi:hypothetical protein